MDKTNQKLIRCAIYDRVSTEEQALYGISLATQVEDLTKYANDHGYTIVGYYGDEGITARKNLKNRKQFMRLLDDVKKDKIDLILVTKLDRWFRNVRDYHNTQAILEEHHCNWKTIYEDYDTSTADGQLKINIMLAVAQNECDRTSERIKVVLQHKVRNGEHVTGAAPYGYILAEKKLAKDPETEHIVEDIFRFYFTCFSKRKTAFYIADKYQDHPKQPTVYQVNRILSSVLYAGVYKDMDDFFPAYVTKDQIKLIKETSDSKTYSHSCEPYIFSGLVKCTVCGKNLSGYIRKRKCKDGSVTKHKKYRCSKKFDHKSGGPCISEDRIEKYMLDHLCQELNTVVLKLESKPSQVAVSKIPSIKAEMERLNTMYQKGRISDDYYDQQYACLENYLAEEMESSSEGKIEKYIELQNELSGNWIELYNELDSSHKNAFWKRIVKEIHIDKETHKICGFSFN